MNTRFSLLVFLLTLGYAALFLLAVRDPVLKPFLWGATAVMLVVWVMLVACVWRSVFGLSPMPGAPKRTRERTAGGLLRRRAAAASASGAEGSGAGLGARVRMLGRSSGRQLLWLPFVGVAVGLLSVLLSIEFVFLEWAPPVTWPHPAATTAPLAAGPLGVGDNSWTSAPGPGNGMNFPGVAPAVLRVELISLDIATRTISARLTLFFTDSLVSHLRFASVSYPGFVPLAKVPPHVWAKLPVDIQLISCGGTINSSSCPSIASIPLGQLDVYGLGGSGSIQTAVTLPILGWPDRFPSDTYVLITTPQVFFPNNIFLNTRETGFSGSGPNTFAPAKTVITADSGLGGHTLTVVEGSGRTRPLVVGLLIGRPILYRITIYLVALLPLLLGVVVVHGSARQAAMKKTQGPIFDPIVIGGLIVAMLAILPLRAVLVPTEINATGLTLVDYILVLDFLFIAAFVFFQYARFVTKPRMPDQTGASEPSVDGSSGSATTT